MKLIAHWVLLASCLLLLGGVDRAWAEGNCPPGYYPIGGQGARGCAPIPGGATGSTGSSEIRLATPTGKWTKTWGQLRSRKVLRMLGFQRGCDPRMRPNAKQFQSVERQVPEIARSA